MSPRHHLTHFAYAFGFLMTLFLSPSSKAAEAGAWETFYTQANANAWTVYDYADETDYLPSWNSTTTDKEDIYFYHTGDNPLWFFTTATDAAGGGKLTGDYTIDGILGIRCDLEIPSLADFAEVDCAVYATNGPNGEGYYYCESLTSDAFTGDGWWQLEFLFSSQWYFFDGTNYLPVTLTDDFLASIQDIGFRIFPKSGTTTEIYTAIDNVILIPDLQGVKPTVSNSPTQFHYAFTPGNGISCTVQQMITSPAIDWTDVPGQSDITGLQEHLFSVPLSESEGFFRVLTSESPQAFTTP